MQKKKVGERSEAKILSHLLEMGYKVSIPWGDSSRYDLLVDTGEKIYRVQCKTCLDNEGSDGTVVIEVSNYNPFMEERSYYNKSEIDVFAVYTREYDEVLFIPIEKIEEYSSSMTIRFKQPERKSPNINWASEYKEL